ncbi:MAG: aminopeptidase N [Aeromonas sp.]
MTSNAPVAKLRHDYQVPPYLISQIDLDVALAEPVCRVQATSAFARNPAAAPSTTLTLDGEGFTLEQLLLDGQPWPHWQQTESSLILSQLPEAFSLTVVSLIDAANNTALEGLYQSGAAYCTQCEAEGFRRITYTLDRPDVLARYTTRISADQARYPYLLSNGNKIDQGALDGGRHFVTWQDPFPKPCYLFALVAGNFDVKRERFITQTGREVALEIFVDQGNLDRADFAMASLINAMHWDERRFNLAYDLDIYMIVAVDFFNMGAMENKGLNIFNAKFVLANAQTATDSDYHGIERVIGHEYFHNWTGNRVTCRDWFQLSLKEGLTVFRDQEFSSDLGSRAVNRISNVRLLRSAQFAEDAGPMAHPIRPDKVIEMNNFYTLTVYEKGAEVIRMLHTLLGEKAFQAGMQIYLSQHDGSAATCEDFVQAMEAASGRDLSQFRCWYSQAGTPELTVTDHYDAASQTYHLTVRQHTPPTLEQSEKAPLHLPLAIALYSPQGEALPLIADGQVCSHIVELTQAHETFVFEQLACAPVPALGLEFSAPVKIVYAYSTAQLALLLRFARNEFIRWDAAQGLANAAVIDAVAALQAQQAPSFAAEMLAAFAAVLAEPTLDNALKAEILTLPSEASLLELFACADVEAIVSARHALKAALGAALGDLPAQLAALSAPHYAYNATEVANRALKVVLLDYLAASQPRRADSEVRARYAAADNMTDTLAALSVANSHQLPARAALLSDFAAQWAHDGLVFDNYLRLIGSCPHAHALSEVETAMTHPTFSLKNPNRLRALIGSFSNNLRAFHAIDGSGYRFLTDRLWELNEINPQVASRLITPLIQFKRLDHVRQQLIKAQLTRLLGKADLARDLYEKVTKALRQ